MNLVVVICTHNRAELLERVLASLNAAKRPSMPVHVLVAANACSDDTVDRMRAYQARQVHQGLLPLRMVEVPVPGKSHALNQAIPVVEAELVALVDDDHRVDENYLVAIENAARAWPEAGLYCGRILPDWDGTEPAWVHDEGPYRIYPLPVPRYDQGDETRLVTQDHGPIPGGGNLVVRRAVFDLAGEFSTALGPKGHDLGGGEDSEYVFRALGRGAICRYVPDIVQYHYVDTDRLQLGYLIRKAYQRTRSTSRIRGNGRVPLYMWRKLGEYGCSALFSLSWARTRFYLVRTAAALGELQGRAESGYRRKKLSLPVDFGLLGIGALGLLALVFAVTAGLMAGKAVLAGVLPAVGVAGAGSIALLAKSLRDHSQTGPRLRQEILTCYRGYSVYSLTRLAFWAFALMTFLGGGGVLVYYALNVTFEGGWSSGLALLAALFGLLGATALQFIRQLRFNPGLLVASMHYRMSRLYSLWQRATVFRIRMFLAALGIMASGLVLSTSLRLAQQAQHDQLLAFWCVVLAYASVAAWCGWMPEARPTRTRRNSPQSPPNILMIGSDTLRADRLGALGYHRSLTPNIDALGQHGALFENCYVPCARTAPSLVSLLTGTWPHKHGIRDNFVADADTRLNVDALPTLLKPLGYRSAAISDWCGADLGKFSFGFDYTDVPEDQWNIKYLIRQGPKDLRLFLSLFAHNRFGRAFLPEVYYLGGVPLTTHLGKRARRLITRLARADQPFLLNVFYSTTHPPFASEWPWYARFSDPEYAGESKFAMAKLTDPFEIIRRQGQPREEFDLDQIINLYDGCVKSFDDEVGRILDYLEKSGLTPNTLVVVYSDHGMEFFEHETWGQGNSAIGDFSARVPIILSGPLIPKPVRLRKVSRTVDIAPTLLDLLGLPPNRQMDGHSLVAALHGDVPPDLPALYETGIWLTDLPGMPEGHLRYPDLPELLEIPARATGTIALKPEYLRRIIAAKDRMIRQGDWKLVYQPLENGYLLRLYDVNQDSGCTRDVITQHPDIVRILWQTLQVWMSSDGYVEAASAVMPLPSASTPLFAPKGAPNDQKLYGSMVTGLARLRTTFLSALRRLDDWVYTRLAGHARVLFVLSDGYGFACQAPVIRALLNYSDVVVRTTTDRGQPIEEVEFASPSDQEIFVSLFVSTRRARLMKWHMVVDTHLNSFYPARNALRAYMHHGPGFGIMGNKTAIIEQCDIFFGLSDVEHQWFERLNPGIFGGRRTFIPVGFPKNDALSRGEFDRVAILQSLGLPDRKTLLITSHWQEQSTLRRLGCGPFQKLAAAFPEFNVIQTGHPWLWQANHKVSANWQKELLKGINTVEAKHNNARFVQTSDVESLLAVADLLVGDYSSVMTTYTLLDRPIVFFNDPEFQFSIPELKMVFMGASHSFHDLSTLVAACDSALSQPDARLEGRRRMRQTFYANEGHSAEYMAEIIHRYDRLERNSL